jgi:hypothetical protein
LDLGLPAITQGLQIPERELVASGKNPRASPDLRSFGQHLGLFLQVMKTQKSIHRLTWLIGFARSTISRFQQVNYISFLTIGSLIEQLEER